MDEIVGLALDMECPVLSESDIQQEFGSPNPSRWAPLMSVRKRRMLVWVKGNLGKIKEILCYPKFKDSSFFTESLG